jgi:hypothetical protein
VALAAVLLARFGSLLRARVTRTALGKQGAAVANRKRTGGSTPKSLAELYEIAKRRDVPGRSKMGRGELAPAVPVDRPTLAGRGRLQRSSVRRGDRRVAVADPLDDRVRCGPSAVTPCHQATAERLPAGS